MVPCIKNWDTIEDVVYLDVNWPDLEVSLSLYLAPTARLSEMLDITENLNPCNKNVSCNDSKPRNDNDWNNYLDQKNN